MDKQRGFTLLEIILVLGLTAIIASTGALIYGNLQPATDLAETQHLVMQTVRQAREASVGGLHNASHGLYVDAAQSKLVIYEGNSYAERVVAADQLVAINPVMAMSDTFADDLNFQKWSGLPKTTGSITLNNPAVGQSLVTVNGLGVVSAF